MNWFRKHAIALGGTAVAVSLLTLTAPRAAHALVAALVQVTNTVATPAITQDVSKLASQNVQLQCTAAAACFQILTDGSLPAPFYIVPLGSRLVITTVQINTTGPVTAYLFRGDPGTARGTWILTGAGSFQFQYPSGIVFSTESTLVFSGSGNPFAGFSSAYLTGYVTPN